MHSDGKSKSREGCLRTKYKWKIKLLKAQMKLEEEMLSFELWMYYSNKWNYLIWWIKDLETEDRVTEEVLYIFTEECLDQLSPGLSGGCSRDSWCDRSDTRNIQSNTVTGELIGSRYERYLQCRVVGAIQHVEVQVRCLWF